MLQNFERMYLGHELSGYLAFKLQHSVTHFRFWVFNRKIEMYFIQRVLKL